MNYLKFKFPLKNSSAGNCLKNSEIASPNTFGSLGVVCVSDYNLYLEQECKDDEGVYIDTQNSDNLSCESKFILNNNLLLNRMYLWKSLYHKNDNM